MEMEAITMVKALQASNNRTEAESAMAKENLYFGSSAERYSRACDNRFNREI